MEPIEQNGYRFHCLTEGSGAHLVFVHGSASDFRTWRAPQASLGKFYRTFAYSRRYHWPNAPIAEQDDYAMTRHVDDLEGILSSLGGGPVHVVGHSYGALVSLFLAIKSPQLIRTLVLVEPPAFTMYVSDPPKPTEMLKLFLSRPRIAAALVKLWVGGLGPATTAMKNNNKDKAMEAFGQAVLGTQTYLRLSDERKEQVRNNLIKAEFLGSGFPPLDTKELPRVDIPTLLLSGDKSHRLFGLLLNRLRALIPNSERKVISDASHIVHEDNTVDFTAAVHAFIGSHVHSPATP